MFKLKKEQKRIVLIDQLIDDYQQHPKMQRVKILKDQLKQEKLEDKIFYQFIKEEIATRQQKI